MLEAPDTIWGVLGTGLAGLIGGLFYGRKKISGDNADIANNRAEIDMIARLQEENRELRTALSTVSDDRNRLYREVGEMVGTMKVMANKQETMEDTILKLTQEVERLRKAVDTRRPAADTNQANIQ